MVWNTVHDEMLCKKILVVDPFTGTKKGTLERGTQWEEVAENLNKIHQVYFKVDKWAVRDRYNLLSKELRNKLEREEKESGIETDMKKVEMTLVELRFAFRIIQRIQVEHFVFFVQKFWILREVSFLQQNK